MSSMTYGKLPVRAEFYNHFEECCPDGIYRVENNPLIDTCSFTKEELFDFIKAIVTLNTWLSETPTALLDLASGILETLDFEWI